MRELQRSAPSSESALTPNVDLHAWWSRMAQRLAEYPITVTQIQPLDQDTALIYTPDRLYEAKIVPAESARFRRAVLDYAASRGFRMTQRFILSIYHDPVVSLSDRNVLYLTDAWPDHFLAASVNDLTAVARNLADLHRALGGFGMTPVGRSIRPDSLQYGRHANALVREASMWTSTMHEWMSQARPPLVREWCQRWLEQARHAASVIQGKGYERYLQSVADVRAISWGGYSTACVRRVARHGTMATLQCCDPQFDDPLYDLATLCHELASQGRVGDVFRTITAYESVTAIPPGGREFVLAYAAYPHGVWRWLQGMEDREEEAAEVPWLEKAKQQRQVALALLAQTNVPLRT